MHGPDLKSIDGQVMRLRLVIQGVVQGVGFRPFIYRLANRLGLKGWVNNSTGGVIIEVEGSPDDLERFSHLIESEKPPLSSIHRIETTWLKTTGSTTFEVAMSETSGENKVLILPDIATCSDCLEDILDPLNRRYLYPFTNCTNCGPRFSIIREIPYDRANTSMAHFKMCGRCREEYENPSDRRFHAQPNACPDCGPQLELWDRSGKVLANRHDAMTTAIDAIRSGKIVAIKGLGGFHLVVDAGDTEAIARLRQRKHREEKPLALMYPSIDLVEDHCFVNDPEKSILLSYQSPIVLLRKKRPDMVTEKPAYPSEHVAPGNPYLGIMLPYTPLHFLLMKELGFPIVATSGNITDEPICIDELEALSRLAGIADLFLVHNRPIVRYVDDSIVHVIKDREQVLRRARGYAPLPVGNCEVDAGILAVGGQLKNNVAISIGSEIFISQHIGDLETTLANDAFKVAITDLSNLYEKSPSAVACDSHPDYESTKYGISMGCPVIKVQHHYAHILSCMGENGLESQTLGIAWDGTGLGSDGTIWGGEFLEVTESSFVRFAHFRTFRLPGGEKAIREPGRSGLGLLYEIYGKDCLKNTSPHVEQAFTETDKDILLSILDAKFNSPVTSSAGRLFDAVASITGLRQVCSFEGQAAMELESMIDGFVTDDRYSFGLSEVNGCHILDWEPMISEIIKDSRSGVNISRISARFHNTLVEMIVSVAELASIENVVLTGGCFQNRYLSERTIDRLIIEGFKPYWHREVPPNDGGISYGQIIGASRLMKGK